MTFTMTTKDVIELFLIGFSAFGTVAVAILAIWGDKIRAICAPALLAIEPHNLSGDLTHFTGHGNPTQRQQLTSVYFFHVKVVNKRKWRSPKNCRLLLKGISRRAPNGEFVPVNLLVPLQFVWAPAEITPPNISIEDEQIVDFGMLPEGAEHFSPRLYTVSNNFQGNVGKGEAERFSLQIVSDSYISPVNQLFEVAWNGKWTKDREEMRHNISITEVKP